MVLFDNLYQPVSWRSDTQAHPCPGEGEKLVLLWYPSWCFWQDLPQSKRAASPIAEPAMLTCRTANTEEEDFFSLCVSPIAAVTFSNCLIIFWAWCHAAGSIQRQPLPVGACWRMGRWQEVRQPRCHALRLSPIPPFEGQVSCNLALNSQLERSFPCFLWITRKRRRETLCRLRPYLPFPRWEDKGSIFRAAARPGSLNAIPYRRRLWRVSAFTSFALASW